MATPPTTETEDATGRQRVTYVRQPHDVRTQSAGTIRRAFDEIRTVMRRFFQDQDFLLASALSFAFLLWPSSLLARSSSALPSRC